MSLSLRRYYTLGLLPFRHFDPYFAFVTKLQEDVEKAWLDMSRIGTSAGSAWYKVEIAYHVLCMSGQFQYLADVCGNFGPYIRSPVNKALTTPFAYILVSRTHVFLEGAVSWDFFIAGMIGYAVMVELNIYMPWRIDDQNLLSNIPVRHAIVMFVLAEEKMSGGLNLQLLITP